MTLGNGRIIDISLALDAGNYRMHTPAGFARDMQFAVEVLKEHDAPGGAGQIVRGVHMRLHAGSHVDAPEHMVKGGSQLHELALETFAGAGVVADLRHRVPGGGITAADLRAAVGTVIARGDRLLLRTDCNKDYFARDWARRSPYLTRDAVQWCIDQGVVLVGFDFYHGNDEPDSNVVFYTSRTLGEHGIVTMPYLDNLDAIAAPRFTLIALPLKMIGVEASPVRAVVIEP
ncbi:MAG TPA: cyclase family protein [Stellaceae bacterium]|nr:cyclase family protein [Stellaceae bacterium]